MSGGHYDYAYSKMQCIAESIRDDCKEGSEYSSMPSDILVHMEWVADRIVELAEAAHDIEWLMSGDYGADTLRDHCKSWSLTGHLRAELRGLPSNNAIQGSERSDDPAGMES